MYARHTNRPHHSYYPHTNAPATPDRSAANMDDRPWYHVAHTYSCVAENEYFKGDQGKRKTEQWILQQRMLIEAENAKYRQASRGSTAQQQKIWEETVYWHEIEAERRMRHGEEARRRAAEKEKKVRLINEEIRKIETKVRIKLEEERRKMAEERRKMEEKQKEFHRQNRLRATKAVVEAWRKYEERWNNILASSSALDFASIPWPVFSPPGTAEDITSETVVEFLFSRLHSEEQTRKDRLRRAQLRWHPDRFQRVLARVKDEDKAEVERAAGIVARSLNDSPKDR